MSPALHKTQHRKLKTKQHKHHQKLGVISGRVSRFCSTCGTRSVVHVITGILYQLWDIYSVCRRYWSVATKKWKVHNRSDAISLYIPKHTTIFSDNMNVFNQLIEVPLYVTCTNAWMSMYIFVSSFTKCVESRRYSVFPPNWRVQVLPLVKNNVFGMGVTSFFR